MLMTFGTLTRMFVFQPALYENIVSDTLQQLQEVVHAKPGEMQVRPMLD